MPVSPVKTDQAATIDLFHERLYPGGVLLLGHSESLLNVSTAFELLHLRDDLAYRRPLLSAYGYASPRAMPAAKPVTEGFRRRDGRGDDDGAPAPEGAASARGIPAKSDSRIATPHPRGASIPERRGGKGGA